MLFLFLFVHYIATKGESAECWKEAFEHFFLEKQGHPVSGSFDVLYCDLGSGLQSAAFKGFLESLCPNVEMKAHKPKNPQSKGIVEARIGAHKRIFEKFLDTSEFKTIEELNAEAMRFMIWHQTKTKRFEKYIEGLKKRPSPVYRITSKNIQDAKTIRVKRQVDAYRCISYNAETYFVPVDVPVGTEIDIYLRQEKLFAVIDNEIVELQKRGALTLDDKDAFRIPERIQRIELVKKSAKLFQPIYKEYKQNQTQETLEQVEKQNLETHSPIPEESLSIQDAVSYVVRETGIDEAEYVEYFKSMFEKVMDTFGTISRSLVLDFVKTLKEA